MTFKILTLFPEVYESYLKGSIIGRAIENGYINVELVNFRNYSTDKHRKVDDIPYGGGAGMVLGLQPLADCINDCKTDSSKVVFLTPKGKVFNQDVVKRFADEKELVIVCGHYEDFDARIFDLFDNERLSIGDYILTGGELPSLVITEAVSRYITDVIKKRSLEEESFNDGLIEYDHYTRPQSYEGLDVPDVLLSGHHKMIEKWRRLSSLFNTFLYKPELLETASITDTEKKLLKQFLKEK